MSNLTIKNARLSGYEHLQTITINDGVITQISSTSGTSENEVIDAQGNLVLPPFCEPHIHLDTTQTAGEPNWNLSGTLFEGIERWAERKGMLSVEDG